MKPPRTVRTLRQLFNLADERRAVIWRDGRRPMPAAWLQNWPARVLERFIARGSFLVYVPKKKRTARSSSR